ncbi:MAG TPA: aldolase/citrate lyase family protein [Alphaproteobacteria bacterium]|nr:aldolase/citrate lyase family protein [Alphaproteobacteria bacterium]
MLKALRYNKIIDLLEQGKPAFIAGTVSNGSLDELTFIADSDYDGVIIETEHEGFSFTTLRLSLQCLLNRKRIAAKASLQPDVVPLVRIPPNGRDRDQWVIKQMLDTGVYGLVLPHLNTVEEARAAVVAARYPQVPGVADFEPAGQRGWSRLACRYWGLTPQEYYDAADLWPLDPDGNILLMGIVEETEGVKNIRDILRQVKGIGAIWAGPGDLSISMGLRGDTKHPQVQEALLQVLAACKEFGVPCAIGAAADEVAMRLEQGFRLIIAAPTKTTPVLDVGRRMAGR